MYRDLREFINDIEKIGELKRIDGADPNLEMGAITEVAAASDSCPALLFDKIKGYPQGYKVVTNLLHTPRRLALAIDLPLDLQGVPFVKAWKDRMQFGQLPPIEVGKALFREKVMSDKDVDILTLPSPKWHEHDGGKYLGTGAITVVRDPDSGYINLGIYRLQLHDRSTLGILNQRSSHVYMIRQKYWSKGESCPVAVCIGVDPSLWLVAVYQSVPFGVSEYDVAGWLRGKPVEVVRGDLTGLPVPATAEVVLEGEILPPEVDSRTEGPFGEFTGYYGSGSRLEPVIRVRRVMHREAPILHGAPPMKPLPGLYHFGINWRAALIWSDLEKAGIRGVTGVWQHGSNLTLISLRQMYAGHAKQAALAALTSANADLTRFIVTLDDDVDPSNLSEVMWAMSTRCDPAEIDIVKGLHAGVLDPRLPAEDKERENLTMSRAVINACRPYHWRNTFPRVNEVSAELRAATLKKWGHVLG